jgi:hypothetical protein
MKRRTLGLELLLLSDLGDQHGGEAGLAPARTCAHPTQLLVGDPFVLVSLDVLARSHDRSSMRR